jgi:hypothetical protein
MEKLRPFLAAFLGLTLWVQGMAIAAAPAAMADAAPAAADTAMEMPCHGDEAAPSVSPCDCCDGDCANMTGCVVGSFVGAATVPVAADPPAHAAIAARTWSAKTAVSPLPLRPPITSHA